MASAAARHTVANYSLKRTAADGLRYHHAHCGSGRLARALGLCGLRLWFGAVIRVLLVVSTFLALFWQGLAALLFGCSARYRSFHLARDHGCVDG